MSAAVELVLGQNVTLVYDSLDLLRVERDRLRAVKSDGGPPSLIDNPEVLVAIFPPEPTVVQVGDRRIRVSIQAERATVGDPPIWEIACRCANLIDSAHSQLIAYGFNYHVGVRLTDMTYMQWAKGSLVRDIDALAQTLGGDIDTVAPRVKFRHASVEYDMILDPVQDDRLQIHLNAHFERPGTDLSSANILGAQYNDAFAYLHSIVASMFKGTNR